MFFSALKIVGVIAVLMPMVAYAVLVERKISALIQDRLGPNRVGPFGIWQPLADGVKFLLKEDFTPAHVRKVYFWLAPAITMIPALLTVAVIPFGSNLGSQKMVIADLNVGILYTFRHRFAGCVRHRAGGLCHQLEVSVSRRHPLQRAD